MAGEVVIIRYPDGEAEFFAGSSVPTIGDTLARRDATWIVSAVQQSPHGRVRITLRASEVERDDGWPKPFDFSSALTPQTGLHERERFAPRSWW